MTAEPMSRDMIILMKNMIKLLLIMMLLEPVIFASASYGAGWYTNTADQTNVWLYRQKITISAASVEATLTNFPLLVRITDSTNTVFSKARSNGQDIVFTDSDGTTKLNHEMEYYVNTAGSASMDAWVKVPTISPTSDTTVYMYYGSSSAATQENPTGVWDSNFKAVWHMSDGGTTTREDSTSNYRHGKPHNYTATTEVIGLIGKADHIYPLNATLATSQYVTLDAVDSTALNCVTGESISISAWVRIPAFAATAWIPIFAKGDSAWRLSRYNTTDNPNFGHNFNGNAGGYNNLFTTVEAADNQWHYIVGEYDTAGTTIIYCDGTMEASASGQPTNAGIYDNYPVNIGDNAQANSVGINATIDEVRVSKTARGRGWIRACYNSQKPSSGFFGLGQEENRPSATIITGSP